MNKAQTEEETVNKSRWSPADVQKVLVLQGALIESDPAVAPLLLSDLLRLVRLTAIQLLPPGSNTGVNQY